MILNNYKAYLIYFLTVVAFQVTVATEKKTLTHDDYASWKSIKEYSLSNNGKYLCFVIEPQEGNGILYIENLSSKYRDSIQRGYGATFSPNSNFIIFKIKPQFDTLRAAKLKKVKKEKLPKDSIGIWNLETGNITKYPNIKSFKLAKTNSDFIALLVEKEKVKKEKKERFYGRNKIQKT